MHELMAVWAPRRALIHFKGWHGEAGWAVPTPCLKGLSALSSCLLPISKRGDQRPCLQSIERAGLGALLSPAGGLCREAHTEGTMTSIATILITAANIY